MSEGSSSTEVSAEATKVECFPAENSPEPTISTAENLDKTGDIAKNSPESFQSSSSTSVVQQATDISQLGTTDIHHGAVDNEKDESSARSERTEANPSSPEQPKQVCSFFVKSGWCRFERNCRYLHPYPSQTSSSRTVHYAGADRSGEDGSSAGARSPQQPTCRFFARSGWCRYGLSCRFSHLSKKSTHDDNSEEGPVESVTTSASQLSVVGDIQKFQVKDDAKGRSSSRPKRCRFYDAGSCRMGKNCRFLHEAKAADPNVEIDESQEAKDQGDWQPARKPAAPSTILSRSLADLKDGDAEKMKASEISQLKRRFPGDKLDISGDESDPLYRFTIVPSDPDWPYDLKDFDVQVSFPGNYPLQPMCLELPEDQVVPSIILKHMSDATAEWLEARHATNQLSSRVELMVRPFLRWFDRNLMRLFTEGARKFKKEVYAKAAGFEFISYADQGGSQASRDDEDVPAHHKARFISSDMEGNIHIKDDEDEEEEEEDDDDDEEEEEEDDEGRGMVARPTSSDSKMSLPPNSSKYESPTENRRGTEIRFPQLEMSESAATLTCNKIKLRLQCSRCKGQSDLSLAPGRAMVLGCSKCQSQQAIAFRPCIIHQFSHVLGFLDLTGCVPVDLIVFDCGFLLSCLECAAETNVQGIQYGQKRQVWCSKCNQKMSIAMETAKFQRLMASAPEGEAQVVTVKKERRMKDPAIREGFPLPASGTCRHYKKSFRWLRFPCCGKCYPCDECHDLEETDHEMLYATRMICGFCAREQPYSVEKPCLGCGSSTTKGRTSHWEGGSGCRNKTKMNRNDKQKFSNLNKTTSRKAQKLDEAKKGKKK